MKLKMIKLVTGEVVIGDIIDINDEIITMSKPMLLMLDPTQGGVGMIPYDIIYTQQELESKVFKIMHIIEENMYIDKSFSDAYVDQISDKAAEVLPEIQLETEG